MASLTIELDERTHERLRERAAEHGSSVEAEAHALIEAAVRLPEQNFLLALHASMAPGDGFELDLPVRGRHEA